MNGLLSQNIGLGASPFSGCFAGTQQSQQQPYNHFEALAQQATSCRQMIARAKQEALINALCNYSRVCKDTVFNMNPNR